MDQPCRNVNVGKSIKKVWQGRFDHLNFELMTSVQVT